MKAEANLSLQKLPGGLTQEQSLAKTSAFGSFFNMVNQKKKQREQAGITEDMYARLHLQRPAPSRGNFPESNIRSLVLILQGSCNVVNPVDDFHVVELRSGNHFGASDLLRIADIEYLGNIVAGAKGVKCMVIPKPDQVI